MNEPDDRLNQIQKRQKETEELLQKLQKPNMDEFLPFEGQLPISQELQQALSTLIKLRYRGISAWRVQLTYRFKDGGVQVKTYVRADDGPLVDFTESEAIIIAAALLADDQEQQKGDSEPPQN